MLQSYTQFLVPNPQRERGGCCMYLPIFLVVAGFAGGGGRQCVPPEMLGGAPGKGARQSGIAQHSDPPPPPPNLLPCQRMWGQVVKSEKFIGG